MSLPKKIIHNLREKGLVATIKKAATVSLKSIIAKRKTLKQQLRKQIDQHNHSYTEISRLVLEINGGIHPKHKILNYHQYFLDHIEPTDLVLDLGCGNGYLAYDLAQKAKEVIGIDIVPKNITFAQDHYRRNNLQFLVGNAASYPYGKIIDKIVLSNVLEHLENRKNFLDGLHHVSKIILLRVPLITRDWLAVYKKESGFEYRLDKTHFIEYTPTELKKELADSGWSIASSQINWGELWGEIISNQ